MLKRKAGQSVSTAKAITARGIAISSSFLMAAFISRLLTPEEAGLFFLFYAVIAVLATVGRFGCDNLALRIVSGASQEVEVDVARLAKIVLVASVTTSIAGTVPVMWYLSESVGALVAALAASSVVAQSFSVFSGAILRGKGRISTGIIAELGSVPTITIGLLGAIFWAQRSSTSLSEVLAAYVVASWLTMAWSVLLSLRGQTSYLFRRQRYGAASFFKQNMSSLSAMMGASLLTYGSVWAPIFVLSATGDLVGVSQYSVAYRLANITLLLPSIQISYLAPRFARLFYAGKLPELNDLARRSVGAVAGVSFVPVFVLMVWSGSVLAAVFGEPYAEAAAIMRVLLGGLFVVLLCGQVNQLMLLCGLERVALLLSSLSIALWLALGWVVSGKGGALSVAIFASSLAILYAIGAAGLLQKNIGVRSYVRFRLGRQRREPD